MWPEDRRNTLTDWMHECWLKNWPTRLPVRHATSTATGAYMARPRRVGLC